MTPVEIFSEAVSVIPWIHVPIAQAKRILVLGNSAKPIGDLALRFPEVQEVRYVGVPAPKDARATTFAALKDLPAAFNADLAVVAIPSISPESLAALRRVVPHGLVCIALERFNQASSARAAIRPLWREVTIFRENLPEPAAFVLASNLPIERVRPVPKFSKRYTDKFVPALFTFAKDEYQTIFGAEA